MFNSTEKGTSRNNCLRGILNNNFWNHTWNTLFVAILNKNVFCLPKWPSSSKWVFAGTVHLTLIFTFTDSQCDVTLFPCAECLWRSLKIFAYQTCTLVEVLAFSIHWFFFLSCFTVYSNKWPREKLREHKIAHVT